MQNRQVTGFLARLWRLRCDGDRCVSVDSHCVEDCSGDRLIAWGRQGEAVGPGVRTSISWREVVIAREDSCGIGTGEVDVAVDDRIWFSLIHHVNRHGESSARGR